MACMQTEQKLIKRIKKKQDKEAANTLISYYYKEIYAYVYRQTGNEELAKDLTQDIFIQILQKIAMFDHKKASFRTWIYRIASNKIYDHYRSKTHRLSLKREPIDMTDENMELQNSNLGLAIKDLSELIVNKELIEKIMEIRYGNQKKYPEIKLIGYTCLLMTEILPLMELQPCANTNNSTLRSILDYCDTHYNEHLTLDDAANALHLSKYYISRLMNDKIKFGFNDYLNTLRVNYACELLSVTDMHISYISEISGFGTIRTFNRVFQSIKHISPLEYRKQNFKPKKNDAENKTDVGDF